MSTTIFIYFATSMFDASIIYIKFTLTVSLAQTKPFPHGEYVLKYTIHDLSSGNSFDIIKNIRIANG
jgi:hypothetical protein